MEAVQPLLYSVADYLERRAEDLLLIWRITLLQIEQLKIWHSGLLNE